MILQHGCAIGEHVVCLSAIVSCAEGAVATGVVCLLLFCAKDLSTIGNTVNKALGRKADSHKDNKDQQDNQ